jgi:hypothetical protein
MDMSDNIAISAGVGTTVAADEVTDGTLGSCKVQYVKLMDGTLDGTTKAAVGSNGLACDIKAIAAGTNLIGKVGVDQTTPGTTNAVSLAQIGTTTVDANSGNKSAGTLRVVLATDQPALTNAQPVALQTVATGGSTAYRALSANNTTGLVVKASAGTLLSLNLTNTNAAARYVKVYNKATAPSVGTDTPIFTFLVPGATTGGVNNVRLPVQGVAFAIGIGLGITTGVTDGDTTAPAANEVIVNASYA